MSGGHLSTSTIGRYILFITKFNNAELLQALKQNSLHFAFCNLKASCLSWINVKANLQKSSLYVDNETFALFHSKRFTKLVRLDNFLDSQTCLFIFFCLLNFLFYQHFCLPNLVFTKLLCLLSYLIYQNFWI